MERMKRTGKPGWRAVAASVVGFVLSYAVALVVLPDRVAPPVDSVAPRLSDKTVEAPRDLIHPGNDGPQEARPAEVEKQEASELGPSEEAPSNGGSQSLNLGVLLWGTVKLPDGNVVPEAHVSTLLIGGDSLYAPADEKGRYVLGPLPFGSRRVRATAMFHHADELELVLPQGNELLRHDFVLEPEQRVIVRTVTSDGEPTFKAVKGLFRYNAVPVATKEDPGDTFTGVVGSLNNQFGIGSYWACGQADVPQLGEDVYGIVTLHEAGPAWLSFVAMHQVLEKQRIDESTEEVTFVLNAEDFLNLACKVQGRLLDADTGEALLGSVQVGEDPFPWGEWTQAGADGVFAVENALVGEVHLIAQAEGRARVVIPLSLAPGEQHDAGDIILHQAITLAGSVRRESGEPLTAVVEGGRFDPSTGAVDWFQNVLYETEADGTFSIGGLEPGSYVLRSPGLPARSPRPHDPKLMSLPVRVDASSFSVDGIELVLLVTTPITVVAENVTEPWPHIMARDSSGLPIRWAWPGRWGTETVMFLPPGEFTLETVRNGVVLKREPLVVGDRPQRLEFSFD